MAHCYKGGAEYGPIPYHPVVLFKMLLISYLYNLSERQTEEFVGDSLAARYFIGLAVDELAPTLSVFKDRLLEREGPGAFEKLFQRVVRLAKGKGRTQIVDATHSVADVDVRKDQERRDGGSKPRDRDAAWGSKGRQRGKRFHGRHWNGALMWATIAPLLGPLALTVFQS